jgi:hypothetical protein
MELTWMSPRTSVMAFLYITGRFIRSSRTEDTKYIPIIHAMNKTNILAYCGFRV